MSLVRIVFLILALVCFLIGTVSLQPPGTRQINWESAGLALLVVAYLLGS